MFRIIIIFSRLRVFHTSVSWWFSTGVWVTASLPSLQDSSQYSGWFVVWMVSSHPLISKSSSPHTKPLVPLPSAPITIGITVTFMFHRFFSSWARSRYLSLFSLSFSLLLLLLFNFQLYFWILTILQCGFTLWLYAFYVPSIFSSVTFSTQLLSCQ